MSKYVVKKDLITQRLGENVVLFDSKKSFLHTLNKTASLIFQKIKIGWSEDKIVQFLLKNYDVKEPRAKKDLEKILKELLKKKVIIRSSSIT